MISKKMISKKRAFVGAVALVIITFLLTFTLTNTVELVLGDKVIISKNNYQSFKKMLSLKNFIEKNYYKPVESSILEEGTLKGMFQSLGDPYSVYMDKEEFNEFMVHTKGSYGGIGVIMTPGSDGFITVVSPIEDTPGDRAGMKPGDKILKVNNKEVTAEKLEETVAIIKGKPGTKVRLTVMRAGKDEPFSIELVREEIRLKTVTTKMLPDNIGYIRISMFDEQTAEDFVAQLRELEKNKIKGLVVDLRNNPGGIVDECVKIADQLLGKQVIFYTQDREGNRQYEKSDEKKVPYPYVLLVNEGSASASEILAGAVQDKRAGILVGTKTFGKALVQQIKPLNDGTGFKLTVAQYFTPNGRYIHGKGIQPDVVVDLPSNLKEKLNISDVEDTQLQKGIEVLKKKISEKQ